MIMKILGPEKADYKAKTTWIKQKGSWTMMGCKKRGMKKCNKIKPPKAVMMQTKGTLQFSCGKTMVRSFKTGHFEMKMIF